MTNYQESFTKEKEKICNYLLEDDIVIEKAFIKEGRYYTRLDYSLFTPTAGITKYLICQAMKNIRLQIYQDHYDLFKDKISWDEVDSIYKDCYKRMLLEGREENIDYNKVAEYFKKEVAALK